MNFKNRNVLVTGGAGFIGSSIVRELLKEKAKVIVYDNFLSGDISNLQDLGSPIDIIKGDILDKGLTRILKAKRIEYVFNLAAEPYIPHCYYRPQKFFEVNANGALNVLLACRDAKVKRILQYSTSEVYGTAQYIPMDEDHPTRPLSTYAVSKLAADRLCYTLHHEQGIPVIILRQFNVYGPRETQPYIIPEIITQLAKGPELKLGNITARRDLTYVLDAAQGAIALMKCREAEGEVVNLGTGKDWSVEAMAKTCTRLMGYEKAKIVIEKTRLRPLDVSRLQCNYSKIQKLTGWRPKVSLKEGLASTIEHFKEMGNKWIWETKIAAEEKIWRK
ncbi:MAG: GDP-mannose 4,6-dehydratase [Candidatus Omnitrophica bacterium]|nr:GDP-mannose 4,6-dehydratase [Candidatus Omnitrophota bacterium]